MRPVLISDCQVEFATGLDKREALFRMKALSREFGTQLEEKEGALIAYA
jgi:hypothetical protein